MITLISVAVTTKAYLSKHPFIQNQCPSPTHKNNKCVVGLLSHYTYVIALILPILKQKYNKLTYYLSNAMKNIQNHT